MQHYNELRENSADGNISCRRKLLIHMNSDKFKLFY